MEEKHRRVVMPPAGCRMTKSILDDIENIFLEIESRQGYMYQISSSKRDFRAELHALVFTQSDAIKELKALLKELKPHLKH